MTTPGVGDRLVPIDQSNWRDALRVRVSDEQLPLVADSQPVALVILAKAHVGEGGRRWEPLYGRVGFSPTGETRNAEPVWRCSFAV